ncbi:hypothetical protein IVB18_19950 [Bradyrhizobium sp. 186]|uniref:dioxygenase family protein n=1 Tax=Bradyrhizobium sp. 186 TaxID=2782654 RepID=UPI002064CB26|nr:hypothetical protein [Bradyrhizobium sp. 186]UPK39302.1 hypothetical protein IVB18_19950 [Bradyrhizobium sp. 186]
MIRRPLRTRQGYRGDARHISFPTLPQRCRDNAHARAIFDMTAGPDWMRPPHIHFEIHGRFERLITQMYFPDEPLNACDRLLNAAPRPDLLIAKPVPSEDGSGHRVLNFDIVLARG